MPDLQHSRYAKLWFLFVMPSSICAKRHDHVDFVIVLERLLVLGRIIGVVYSLYHVLCFMFCKLGETQRKDEEGKIYWDVCMCVGVFFVGGFHLDMSIIHGD